MVKASPGIPAGYFVMGGGIILLVLLFVVCRLIKCGKSRRMAGTAGQQATEEAQASASEGEMAEESQTPASEGEMAEEAQTLSASQALENPRKSDTSREAE